MRIIEEAFYIFCNIYAMRKGYKNACFKMPLLEHNRNVIRQWKMPSFLLIGIISVYVLIIGLSPAYATYVYIVARDTYDFDSPSAKEVKNGETIASSEISFKFSVIESNPNDHTVDLRCKLR